MITLQNIALKNAENKIYFSFDGSVNFNDDSVYFIIGRSGVGKTSLVDFMTSPFTDDPIKSGEIILSDNIALNSKFSKNPINMVKVGNSWSFWSNLYIKFIQKSVALIPQKTDSFHPSIPVVQQMFDYYKMALPAGVKPNRETFNRLLVELSPFAGWNKISVNPKDKNSLLLSDKKEYIEDSTGEIFTVIDKQEEPKTYENEFSTGQLQRILILMGLIQFSVSDHPILIGDEFLVNFTYFEASEVLKKVIEFFQRKNDEKRDDKKHKVAIFILHDLSFDFLKTLKVNYPVEIIGIEEDLQYANMERQKTETSDAKKIITHQISVLDFFAENWKGNEGADFFRQFKNSYESSSLPVDECKFNIKNQNEKYQYDIDLDASSPYLGVYKKINLGLKKNKFIVLTGFSGCGKSTLCNQYVNECIENKRTFRYFPSKSLSFLSEDSQVSIRQDLSIMYNYYNRIINPMDHKSEIAKMLNKVHFGKKSMIGQNLDAEFLDKKIFNLSGGELQRYWLARILFDYYDNGDYVNPELLILDESIASLDCITKNKIIALLLQEVLSEKEMAVLFVSHDLRDIGVIYKTLLENSGGKNIDDIFEHYEMFHKKSEDKDENQEYLWRVKTPFPDYCINLENHSPNIYQSLNDKSIQYKLKFNITLPEENRIWL
jgi:ABC-type dipeptide/oligopeptide/nickel transport system ATPase subunit